MEKPWLIKEVSGFGLIFSAFWKTGKIFDLNARVVFWTTKVTNCFQKPKIESNISGFSYIRIGYGGVSLYWKIFLAFYIFDFILVTLLSGYHLPVLSPMGSPSSSVADALDVITDSTLQQTLCSKSTHRNAQQRWRSASHSGHRFDSLSLSAHSTRNITSKVRFSLPRTECTSWLRP